MAESVTRRDAIKKAAWIAPVILTLPVTPTFARAGSGSYQGKPAKENPGRHLGWAHRKDR